MSINNEDTVEFSAQWDIDLLVDGYPKIARITIPPGSYPTYYTTLIENITILPAPAIPIVDGDFKSITDSDSRWHQLTEAGFAIVESTGGRSGANCYIDLRITNSQIILYAANWNSGPLGASRSVTIDLRYYLYATRADVL